MNRLVLVFVAVLCLSTVLAKDEAKDAIVKKQQKVEPVQQQKASAKLGAGVSGLKCYQCNSQTAGEEDCDSTDIELLQKFAKPCPALPQGSSLEGITGAKSCRKIEQNVFEEPTRVIRECAYTGDEELDGKKRTGNKGIINYLYVCFNEEDGTPCNPASQTVYSIGAVVAIVVAQIFQRF